MTEPSPGPVLLAAFLVGTVLAGCGAEGPSATVNAKIRLDVVTTVSPITGIVSTIGGRFVHVTGLIPEGADSHTFEPPPSTAELLSRADLVFVNGLKLEDPTKDLARQNLKSGAEIVELGTKTIAPSRYISDFSFPKDGGKPNPHLWTNPPCAKSYGRIAADAFQRRDPRHARDYEANFQKFLASVDHLDRAMKLATASMAPKQPSCSRTMTRMRISECTSGGRSSARFKFRVLRIPPHGKSRS